jgi:hypothetical protein
MRTKLITTDTQVSATKINVWGIVLYPLSANGATITLYNEATSSKTAAKKVSALMCPYGANGSESKQVMFARPLVCEAGLYADLEGTSAVGYVYVD